MEIVNEGNGTEKSVKIAAPMVFQIPVPKNNPIVEILKESANGMGWVQLLHSNEGGFALQLNVVVVMSEEDVAKAGLAVVRRAHGIITPPSLG